MANSKIQLADGTTLIDLTQDTVNPAVLQKEYTAHDAAGNPIVGEYEPTEIKLESISITTPPTKTVYLSGESFDPAGMVVTVIYSNGATLAATGYAVEPSGPLTDGMTHVTIRYTEGGKSVTAAQPITVRPKLASIAVTTPPTKTAYRYGEAFAPAGMVVTATYTDGHTAPVTGYTTSPASFTVIGNQSVTVTYTETGVTATATTPVTVSRALIAAVPSQSGSLTYTGGAQSPSWNNYNAAQLTLGGTASATNAGTYAATFTPTANYAWPDGSTAAKSVNWTIGKAAGGLSIAPTALTLNTANPTGKITVTRAGDGAITAESSDTGIVTVSVSGNEVTVHSVNQTSGSATVTVKVAAGTNHTAPGNQTCSVTAQFVTIYGAEWDWTSSGPTRGTRTDAAASFGDPSPAVNNGSGSSPFDNLMPWAGMVKETRSGGVEVKEPKYWFKWTKTGKKLKLQIADGPVEGFHVDPVNMDKGDGLGELDFSYIGRYHCASDYKSTTNQAPKDFISRTNARTYIHNLGSNFWQMDFAQFWYVNMLFLVEFADWNGERIGRGCSASDSKENNGQTDAMQYHTGTTASSRDSYGSIQYRNIEGWWSGSSDWIDGCYTNVGTDTDGAARNLMRVIKNPSQFGEQENGTIVGGLRGGYPSDFTIPTESGFEWALVSCAADGSTSSYVPDKWSINVRGNEMYHGNYVKNQNNGPFNVVTIDAKDGGLGICCRLQERPPKTV